MTKATRRRGLQPSICWLPLKRHWGILDHLSGVVKLVGMVSVADGFYDMPKVINGASDLFMEIFGRKGYTHALLWD